MPQTLSNRFYSLFFSVYLLFAGFGLFLNSAGVKLSQMGADGATIGALNAAFFIGAAFSAVAAHRIISAVGHIRSFSVFGALFAMSALAHLMTEHLYAWAVLRTLLGFCYYSMLMIVESWFAEQSAPKHRARVLAFYNLVYYLAFTAGLMLLSLNLSSNNIFVLATLLVMAAMIPVSLTRLKSPEIPPRQKISLPRVLAIAPLAFVTAFCGGVMVNGLFTMASVYLLQQGYGLQQISIVLISAMAGGFLVQLPVAKLSDRFGRRNIILASALVAAASSAAALTALFQGYNSLMLHNAAAFGFGCGTFTLYALSLARANDRLPKNMNTVEVSRSLLFCYGIGSLIAPLVLGVVIDWQPQYGFYGFYTLTAVLLALFAYTQKTVPKQERGKFVAVPSSSASMAAELDPRNETADQAFDPDKAKEHIAAVEAAHNQSVRRSEGEGGGQSTPY